MIKDKIIASSQNPDKLSMTVTGILIGLVPVMLALFKVLGVEGITETGLYDLFTQVGVVIASVVAMYGMLRKVKNAIIDELDTVE